MNSLNVFNLQQDSTGLMHVTTDNGVYLHNGYSFSLIKNDLPNPTILSSFIKDNSTIYLSTNENGITEVNYKLRQQKQIGPKKLNSSVDQIVTTNDHMYILSSTIRLQIIDLKTNELIGDAVKETDKNNQAHCIYKTKDGRILVGRSNGLYEMQGITSKKLDLIKNLPAYAITENSKGELVIGSASKIFIAKDDKLLKEIVPVYKTRSTTFSIDGEKSINKLLCDNFGRIWFSSSPNDNIYVYCNGATHDVFNELNITPILINCIYKDRDDNIWIGTMEDGIYVIQNTFFTNISISPDNKPLSVNKIHFKNDLILTATSNGFYAYNYLLNEVKTISEPDNFLNPILDVKDLGNMIYYTKRSQIDLSGSIVVSGNNSYKFKPIYGKIVSKLPNGNLVLCDWMANVLLMNSDASKTLDTLISFPDFSQNVSSIYSHGDSLLVATNKGLYLSRFKPKQYTSTGKNPDKKVNHISVIGGQLVVCHDDGIEFLNTGEEIKILGSKPLNGVKKISEMNDMIWIITTDGLFICDKNLNPVKVYNRSNGVSSSSINDISFNDRYTCISTSKGISYALTGDIIQHSSTLNAVTIDMIKINEHNSYYNGRTIQLGANDNDVTVFFNSPYYNSYRYKQYYRYKLDNNNWTPLENTAFNLPALDGGMAHKISIQASIDNINWSTPTIIEFRKEEKFTESKYSYFIIFALATMIASLISYLLIKRVKKRAMKRIADEQQVNLLKHQAMNSLLSPHFIFNSLTSIQNYINSNNSLKASEYLAKFSRLIRMIIEKAAQSEILLTDEIKRLSYYLELEKERFKNKFDYTITVDEKLDANTVAIPNMIIQPHAENCIIHGILPKLEHGKLDITFKKTEAGKLLITIEDDGIGLIKAKEHSKTGHKSLGTATIKNILELNSKLTGKTQVVTMVDKSTLGEGKNGTIITLELEL
ncbi:MAG: histidine kinase [Bacteroidia bacterium]|nr:histidine kinase [Bacteroidia bacterium]